MAKNDKDPAWLGPPPDESVKQLLAEASVAGSGAAALAALDVKSAALAGVLGGLGLLLGKGFQKVIFKPAEHWLDSMRQLAHRARARHIDIEHLCGQEKFAALVVDATHVALRARSDDKRDRLRNLLRTCILDRGVPEQRALTFVRLIDELEDFDVLVLEFMAGPGAFCQKRGTPLQPKAHLHGQPYYGEWGPVTSETFAALAEVDILKAAIDNLQQRNLINPLQPSVQLHLRENKATVLGNAFLDAIKADESEPGGSGPA